MTNSKFQFLLRSRTIFCESLALVRERASLNTGWVVHRPFFRFSIRLAACVDTAAKTSRLDGTKLDNMNAQKPSAAFGGEERVLFADLGQLGIAPLAIFACQRRIETESMRVSGALPKVGRR